MRESQEISENESLRTEYQASEDEINANISNYWLISTIFIGISNALLVALLYAVLGNYSLFNNLIYNISSLDVNIVRLVFSVIGISCLIILFCLKFWVRRVNFLIRMRHRRMHEIEAHLGMWASRTIHIIDNWKNLNTDRKNEFLQYCKIRRETCPNQSELIKELGAGLNEYWYDKKANLKPLSHPSPFRSRIYAWAMNSVIIIWSVLIIIIWLPPIIPIL